MLWVSETTTYTGDPTHAITNMIGYIDAIKFADNFFVEALDNKLTSTDPSTGERTLHLVPFENYKSYTGAFTGKNGITTMRVVANTSLLDKLLFTYMEENYKNNDRLQLGTVAAGADTVVDTYLHEYLKASKDPNILNSSQYFKRNATAP